MRGLPASVFRSDYQDSLLEYCLLPKSSICSYLLLGKFIRALVNYHNVNKRWFLPLYDCVGTTVWMNHFYSKHMKNIDGNFTRILRVNLNKFLKQHPTNSSCASTFLITLIIQAWLAGHFGYYRRIKRELSDVLECASTLSQVSDWTTGNYLFAHSSSVRTLVAALSGRQKRWVKKESKEFALSEQFDYIYIYIYIYIERERERESRTYNEV